MHAADVYERLSRPGRKPTFRSLVVTQLVSGVWHGLFPGYAMFFVNTTFMFDSAKTIYRSAPPCNLAAKHTQKPCTSCTLGIGR